MKPFIYIFDFPVPSYGLLMAIGVVAGLLLFYFTAKSRGIDGVDSFTLGFFTLLFALIGAKLLYLLTDLEYIRRLLSEGRLKQILEMIFFGGMVFYGGVLSGFVSFVLIAKHYKNPLLDAMDAVAPALALGHAFGRLGCFAVGCCYGIETDVYGISFEQSLVAPNHVPLLPVQLMEAVFNLLLSIFLFVLLKNGRKGLAASGYLILYSIWRFFIEFYRGDSYRGFFLGLSTSQWISILLLSVGIVLFFTSKRKSWSVKKKA